jgi:transposase
MYLKVLTQRNKKDGHTRKYLQLVESRRINGQPRQIVLASLGRFDTEQGEKKLEKLAKAFIDASDRLKLINLADDLKALSCKEYGPLLVFKRIWKELGLGKVLANELKGVGTDFDIAEAVFNMVLNRLTAPSSKRQLTLWEQDIEGIESFELHQYYRALDHLLEHKDDIEQGVFHQMRDLFHSEVDIVLFDTTTVAYYGDSDQHEELLDYGFSKIRRSDLKQVVVGIIMSKQGIPLGHEVFEGNKNDVTCFKEIIDKISGKFKLGKVVLVGDWGMISKKNIAYLEEQEYEYILGYRMRTIPDEERHRVFSSSPFETLKGSVLQYKESTYDEKRLIVCFNPERAEKDKKHREEILDRLKKKIGTGKLASLIGNKYYKRFLRIRGEKPTIDEEKVARDAQYDGMFVLTSNTSLSAPEVVMAYKDLWQVELAFRQLKSELEMGPIYHWKDRRIRAHIMICFLAFVMRTSLYKKLKKASEEKVSYSRVVSDLKALKTCELQVGDIQAKVRTEMRPGATLAMKAMGMRPPPRVKLEENLQDVVLKI